MSFRGWSTACVILIVSVASASMARGQAPATAKVEAIPLELKAPDRYQIYSFLEPIRRVTIIAPVDGILRNFDSPIGTVIKERQELGQLDRTEAASRLKIAKANVKEAEAALKGSTGTAATINQAQLEAAQGRVELAEVEYERCTLRAPFAGKLLDLYVSPGQLLVKGTKIGDLADVSSLRALVPFDRASVSAGATVNVLIEGQPVSGKVVTTVPLPESLAPLRELATSFVAALVVFPNTKGDLEPGLRVLSPSLPNTTITTIPSRSLRRPDKGETTAASIQVIRNEYVTDVPVRVLGQPGPDRVQISGLLRPKDSLIVSTSVPLVAGTLIRFNGEDTGLVEGTNPNPAEGGEVAGITPPSGTRAGATTGTAGRPTGTRPTGRPTGTRPANTTPGTPKATTPPPF
ncbi:HlyD family secretion protein [Singulisphaera sp. PoT]|uniref:HlyD family secretion protein n=1 Tax=Singulisphaera sp. PoT TaxID=3411797 RepID=UPI003BF56BAA